MPFALQLGLNRKASQAKGWPARPESKTRFVQPQTAASNFESILYATLIQGAQQIDLCAIPRPLDTLQGSVLIFALHWPMHPATSQCPTVYTGLVHTGDSQKWHVKLIEMWVVGQG